MGDNQFKDALDRFKNLEQPEAVLLVASHKEYVNIAAAWMQCRVRAKATPAGCPDKPDSDIWAWLWENAHFSRAALKERSGVPEKRFEDRLDTLVANRVLYPDGTINSFVRRYLREKVLKLLGVDAKTRRALKVTREDSREPTG